MIKQGTFSASPVSLLTEDIFLASGTKTYYLYVWLDAEETNQNTMNKNFNLSLNGECISKSYLGTTFIGEDGQFEYMLLGDNKIQITRYLGDETELVIPATYEGYQVYSVGNPDAGTTAATRYNIIGSTNSISNSTITSLTISEGIEVIEMAAFSKLTALGELKLPNTLKVIGHTAFNNDKALTGDLVIPDGVEVIDTAAFQSCTGFNGTLTLPNSLTRIGNNAFFKTGFTGDLTIPEGVTTLEKSAFNTCTGFDGTLTIPSTLSVVGEYAFTESTGFTNLVIKEGVTKIEESAFQSLTGITGSLTLPSTLTEIGPFAFSYNNFTGSLTIPDSVTIIGEGAFNSNKGFDGTLTLSNNLVEIGDYAFNHCLGFINTSLDIPDTVQVIGKNETDATHVFYDFATKTIQSYTINGSETGSSSKFKVNDGILYSGDGARLVAYPASKVGNTYEMPEGITIIDELSFSRAGSSEYSGVPDTGLKKIVLPNSYILSTTLPSNYLNVGNNLAVGIYNRTGVNEIAVKDDNPNYKTEDGILYSKDGTTLWYVPIAKSGSIAVADGTTTIKSGAFYSASVRKSIITSVTIPASVTTIDSTELNELKAFGSSKVTFAEGSIYSFDSSGNVVKSS